MSRMDDSGSRISDAELERLVDGELSEPRRRELLSGLDREPEGWRRCALAFLEGQSWCEAMRSMKGAAPSHALSSNPATPPARRRSWLARYSTLLATAASFFVALAASSIVWPIVYQYQGMTPTARLAGVGGDAQTGQRTGAPPAVVSWAGQPAGQPAASHGPWRMVTVSVPGPQGAPQPIQVPAVEQDAWNGKWLGNLPQSLPPELVRALQQSGRQVQQSRQLLSLPMEDGRRLVVPIDRVEIHYVGDRDYQ